MNSALYTYSAENISFKIVSTPVPYLLILEKINERNVYRNI
jgi:hypothetical protein